MTTDDIQAVFADHANSFEARLACHEQRMAEIDAGLTQRIDALLARLDLELDALADQAGRSR